MSNSNTTPKILLLVSGSIAAFKAVSLCSKLVQLGYDIEVVLSESATQFVGPASFEGFTRKKVHLKNFEAGSMMAHIDLERSCDLILNYPSTATTFFRFVHGDGSDLMGAIFLAHEFKKPFWIAPAMNQAMLANPGTQENLEKLESWGARVFLGESGNLACGEVGSGRLIEPEAMLAEIRGFFEQNTVPKRILITAGGTTEPIDPIRSITNFSSGETGFRIAKRLESLGHEVTLLQSKHSKFSTRLKRVILYDTTLDFGRQFEQELKTHSYDVLIHSAAVADYAVESVTDLDLHPIKQTSKIQENHGLILHLKPNPKFIHQARKLSQNSKIKMISFKLTAGGGDLKLDSYDSDCVFHNEFQTVSSRLHPGTFYKRNEAGTLQPIQSVQTKEELIRLISKEINS